MEFKLNVYVHDSWLKFSEKDFKFVSLGCMYFLFFGDYKFNFGIGYNNNAEYIYNNYIICFYVLITLIQGFFYFREKFDIQPEIRKLLDTKIALYINYFIYIFDIFLILFSLTIILMMGIYPKFDIFGTYTLFDIDFMFYKITPLREKTELFYTAINNSHDVIADTRKTYKMEQSLKAIPVEDILDAQKLQKLIDKFIDLGAIAKKPVQSQSWIGWLISPTFVLLGIVLGGCIGLWIK